MSAFLWAGWVETWPKRPWRRSLNRFWRPPHAFVTSNVRREEPVAEPGVVRIRGLSATVSVRGDGDDHDLCAAVSTFSAPVGPPSPVTRTVIWAGLVEEPAPWPLQRHRMLGVLTTPPTRCDGCVGHTPVVRPSTRERARQDSLSLSIFANSLGYL